MGRWLMIVGVAAVFVFAACSSKKKEAPAPEKPATEAKADKPEATPAPAEEVAVPQADKGLAGDPAEKKPADPAPADKAEAEVPAKPKEEAALHVPPTLPSSGDLDAALLNTFFNTANPVPAWVDQAIGGATRPDADPAPFRQALALFSEERLLLKKRRKEIRERTRAVIQAGEKGKLPKRKRLASGFKSHTLIGESLDAAAIRYREGPRVLDGGADQGVALAHLGQLLAAAGVDALVEGKYSEAIIAFKRLTRFGAIVAANSQTLAERAAGVSAAKEGLGLLETVIRRKPDLAGGIQHMQIRVPRRHLGAYGASLGRLNRLFFLPENLSRWEELARTQRDPLWIHEALGSLYRTSWMRPGTEVSTQAYEALKRLQGADKTSPAKAAAGRYVSKLDEKRASALP
ncbi:MAG: hypothetical protein VYE15_01150 [Myxococcota bacterium]|nr:hypothetical protein [Myxococcota bacterium]